MKPAAIGGFGRTGRNLIRIYPESPAGYDERLR
jgi:hypothetical protein